MRRPKLELILPEKLVVHSIEEIAESFDVIAKVFGEIQNDKTLSSGTRKDAKVKRKTWRDAAIIVRRVEMRRPQ